MKCQEATALVLLAAGLAALPLVAHAGDDAASTGAILECRSVADDGARLQCFDRRSAELQAAIGTPQQRFGLAAGVATKDVSAEPELQELASRITSVKNAGDGKLIFYLENGQVWRQVVAGGALLIKPGEIATLMPGALGSFWLKAPSSGRTKVTRLK